MAAKKLLGSEVIGALNIYRINCKNQAAIPWDKDKDRNRIFDLIRLRPHIIFGEAVAGTCWFHFYKEEYRRKTVKVDIHHEPRMAIRFLKKGEKF